MTMSACIILSKKSFKSTTQTQILAGFLKNPIIISEQNRVELSRFAEVDVENEQLKKLLESYLIIDVEDGETFVGKMVKPGIFRVNDNCVNTLMHIYQKAKALYPWTKIGIWIYFMKNSRAVPLFSIDASIPILNLTTQGIKTNTIYFIDIEPGRQSD